MFKKEIMFFIIIFLLSSLLMGCAKPEARITDVTNIKWDAVTKIVFIDGTGGRNKPFTLTNKEKISEFTNLLDHYIIHKEKRHEPATGWIRKFIIYQDKKKLMSITFTNPLMINDNYYEIVKGELNTKEIDMFIRTVNPSWKEPNGGYH
ncbi:MAG: hypothetical protein ACO1OT_16030 [Heyndrickxia sp.]